ncbi:MAG: hypothetical protein K2L42_01350 [Clostridia bacterium]|nr:hypothetical protein [Clostridia bacterium]
MRLRGQKVSPFFISLTAVLAVTAALIILSVSCTGNVIRFKSAFYFVCYAVKDNAVSAGSVSDAVSSFGGAGYVLEYGNAYYITVSCYYTEQDAQTVCKGLKKRNLDCEVLAIEKDEYALQSIGAKSKTQLYTGNLNTLQSLSHMAYDCANALDTGEYSQNNAKAVVFSIENTINGLMKANADNCFSEHFRRLTKECEALKSGYIYSKDMRKLQIAVADTIINVNLY